MGLAATLAVLDAQSPAPKAAPALSSEDAALTLAAIAGATGLPARCLCIRFLHSKAPEVKGALLGKTVGDSLKVSIAPAEGYGELNESLVEQVPADLFQGVDQIEIGMQFHAQTGTGMQVITVTDVQGDMVTVDGNHPLAGQTLHFDVTVKEVRAASKEELEHGHVHGAGGHHH